MKKMTKRLWRKTMKLKCRPMKWKRISQPYKAGKHRGIDLAAPTGTKVVAAQDGIVVAASYGAWDRSYGNHVAIYHSGGGYTNYAHLSKVKTRAGKKVKAGQVIGLCGSTGNSTGPHLHFEVHEERKWNRVDPWPYIVAAMKRAAYKTGKTYVLKATMRVRASHSTNARIVKTVKKGTKIKAASVWESKAGTVWVKAEGGWICALSAKGKVYMA